MESQTSGGPVTLKTSYILNWFSLAQGCAMLDNLSETEKREAESAFRYLNAVVGARVFHITDDFRHPLYFNLANDAPWVKKWSIWFASAIKKFETKAEFAYLIAEIKAPHKYYERLAVLEIADALQIGGFEVRLDPKVSIGKRTKRPDLEVRPKLGGNPFFVEVSDLLMSKGERDVRETFEPIWRQLAHKFAIIRFAGQLRRLLTATELNATLQAIDKIVARAITEQHFLSYSQSDAVEIAVAPLSRTPELESWCLKRGLQQCSLVGPEAESNEPHRIRIKIEREQEQLPQGCPNALVINSEPANSLIPEQERFNALKEAVLAETARFPHIAFVAICCRQFATEPSFRRHDDGCFSAISVKAEIEGTNTLLIPNRHAATKLSPEVEVAFIKAILERG